MIQAAGLVVTESRYDYDLFISYAGEDRPWVEGYLVPALGGSSRIITSAGFAPGLLLDEYQRALEKSRYTLLVVTPAYLSSVWSPSLEAFITTLSNEEQQARLIPLVRTTDQLSLNLRSRVQLKCISPEECEEATSTLLTWLGRPEPPPDSTPCPYLGAEEYPWVEQGGVYVVSGKRHAYAFFGREVEVRKLAQLLSVQRRIFVVGPSGAGKSSLINAGLVPYLSAAQRGEAWLLRRVRPGEPNKTSAESLSAVLEGDVFQPRETVERLLAGQNRQRLCLIIDSFERVFTQESQDGQRRFIEALDALRTVDTCRIVAIVRGDFYDKLLESGVLSGEFGHQFNVEPLRGEGLRAVIVEPARAVGVRVAPELVERLIADCRDQPGALPLLQETLRQLWPARERSYLPLRPYVEMGEDGKSGLAVALANRAQGVYNDLIGAQKEAARRIFVDLVQLGDKGDRSPDTRRRQRLSELRTHLETPDDFKQTIGRFLEARLIVSTYDEEAGEEVLELAHDVLITAWPALQDWIDHNREGLLVLRRLKAAAEEWRRHPDEPGLLYSESRTQEVETHYGRDLAGLDAPEKAFIEAGRREQKLRQRGRYLGQATAGAFGSGLGYGLAFTLAMWQILGGFAGLLSALALTLLMAFTIGQPVGFAIGVALWRFPNNRTARVVTAGLLGMAASSATCAFFLGPGVSGGFAPIFLLPGAPAGLALGVGAGLTTERRRRFGLTLALGIVGATLMPVLMVRVLGSARFPWSPIIILLIALCVSLLTAGSFYLTAVERQARTNTP